VTERALAEVAAVIHAAEPERGDPADALARVVAAAWRTLGRYHALVAINTGTKTHEEIHHRHGSVLGTLLPLIERGQAAGAFRTDVLAAWHLAMLWRSATPAARNSEPGGYPKPPPRPLWSPPSSARSRVPGRA
jgi:hypothetical protein